MDQSRLSKVTAAAAVGALLFSLLGWQAARRAERTAQDAYSAASFIDTSGASYEVEQLTDALVAAGVIVDPQFAHLVGASQVEVAREVCRFLDLEGGSAVATTAAEAMALIERFEDTRWVTSDAAFQLGEAVGYAAFLDDEAIAPALDDLATAWTEVGRRAEARGQAIAEASPPPDEGEEDVTGVMDPPTANDVEEVWSEVEGEPWLVALGAWVDQNC